MKLNNYKFKAIIGWKRPVSRNEPFSESQY